MTEVENFLEHYGVKGMQWGVRKVSRSKTVSDDHKRDSPSCSNNSR